MYPEPKQLSLPVKPYQTGALYAFRNRIRRYLILWATHLGDDVVAQANTPVVAIGDGEVVWAQLRPGEPKHRDWGGVVVLGHTNPQNHTSFFSVYGHLTDIAVTQGQEMKGGDQLGVVAPALTAENGWWGHAHLHFAIYTGPWRDQILPGWARPEHVLMRGSSRKTKIDWWHDPKVFIANYQGR